MPWLIKSTSTTEVPLSGHLFFVHVPRCGGTSLMQHFSIPQRVVEDRGLIKGLAMRYFFMRYGELEKANFPIDTRENFVCALLLLLSVASYLADIPLPSPLGVPLAIILGILAVSISFFTTVICTAPVIGRITPVHRWYLWFVHYPLCRACEAVDWCTGTNKHGYIMHLTAPKLLGYNYVTPAQMDGMCSLAIVRNPYSRMFSIYGYNRFGSRESFPAFCRRWKHAMRHYIERNEKEEWYTPCHLLPMFEYTHYEGRQLVQSIVKQEELKLLKTKEGAMEAMKEDNSVSDLPELVRDALLGMPHTNSRKTSKKWYDHYDQETMDLTYEMYKMDFVTFGYDVAIKERPDLVPPRINRRSQMHSQASWSRNSYVNDSGVRTSQANLFGSVRGSMRKEMHMRSSTSALKRSLVELNRDEILANVAGLRNISTVGEEEEDETTEQSLKKDD
mmetsp:Transcript_3259/g.8307  ORF Transcript_3259/g.8307 Transcript_3259/m.8307 type:complete len:447 (+) Transcript_3259:130-1470(+)